MSSDKIARYLKMEERFKIPVEERNFLRKQISQTERVGKR